MPGTWAAAGGAGSSWSTSTAPAADHPVWQPNQHLKVAIGWMCGNLREVTEHLRTTGKTLEALDALAVCHIAGCSRVFGSSTGSPQPGEAGCDASCATQVRDYLASIHRNVQRFAAPIGLTAPSGSAPQPYMGGATGCSLPDPTGSGGCVTTATAWLITQVDAHAHQGPVSCWDRHAWNPSSDHPLGKACDYPFGRGGVFPGTDDVAKGWALAEWLHTYAGPLRVSYVIWQGRIWSLARADSGWRPYSGGGVYDPSDASGGHYDHVHVSLAM